MGDVRQELLSDRHNRRPADQTHRKLHGLQFGTQKITNHRFPYPRLHVRRNLGECGSSATSFRLHRYSLFFSYMLSRANYCEMVTQLDIARKLGLSRQLVTFALAGYPQVSPESRKLIQAKAIEMGYQPNPHARALREGKTGIVALWIPNQISSHYAHVTRVLTRLLKQNQMELIVSEVGASTSGRVLSHVPVDGIFIVDAPSQVSNYLRAHPRSNIPVISMGAHCYSKSDYVKIDLLKGAVDATQHLVKTGYRRIAHMTFVQAGAKDQERRAGYLKMMRRARLKPEFIHYPLSDRQRPVVRRLIQEYIGAHGCPQAIFCHSDDVAVGVYRGLCDMGLRIPSDVAVMGCDGIEDTEYLECPITTLIQPVQAMCATAWQFFKNRTLAPKRSAQHVTLNPHLVIRDSTRPSAGNKKVQS